MADNDQLLKAIESIKSDVGNIKNDLQEVKQAQAQTNTALETLKAGQEDIREKMATKADVHDLGVKLDKKVKSHESRIENLEEHAGISNPHKN